MAQPVNFNFLEREQTAGSSPRTTPPEPSRIPQLTEQLNYFKARCEQAGYQGSGTYETPLPPPECDAVKSIERQIELEQERLDNYQVRGLASPSPLSSKADGLRAPVEQKLGLENMTWENWLSLPITLPVSFATAAVGATAAIGLTAAGAGLAIGDAVFSEIGNAIEPPPPPRKIEIGFQDVVNFASQMKTADAPAPIPQRTKEQTLALLSGPIPKKTYTDFSGASAITQE